MSPTSTGNDSGKEGRALQWKIVCARTKIFAVISPVPLFHRSLHHCCRGAVSLQFCSALRTRDEAQPDGTDMIARTAAGCDKMIHPSFARLPIYPYHRSCPLHAAPLRFRERPSAWRAGPSSAVPTAMHAMHPLAAWKPDRHGGRCAEHGASPCRRNIYTVLKSYLIRKALEQ